MKKSYIPLRNTLVNSIGTFLSRVTGIIKLNIVNYLFGAGADTFHSANANILALRKVLGEGTLINTFLPVYSKQTDDKEKADRFASNILNQMILLSVLINIVCVFFTPLWTKTFLPGFNDTPDLFNEIITLTSIMLFSTVFFSAFSIAMGILNCHDRFLTSATAPILSNIAFIVIPILTYKQLGIFSLAWAIVIGSFLQFLLEVVELFSIKFRYRFVLDFKDPAVKNFWKLFFPTAGNYLTQAGISIGLGYFASFLPRGSMTYLRNANTIIIAPVGFIGAAMAGAIFPIYAKVRENKELLSDAWAQSLTFFLFASIPIAGFFYFYPDVIVNLVFRDISVLFTGSTGSFTTELQTLTADALKILSTILIPWSLNIIVGKFLYALEKPNWSLFLIIVNFTFNIVGYKISQIYNFGGQGLVYSDLIAAWATTLTSVTVVYCFLPKNNIENIKNTIKNIIIFTILTVICWILLKPLYYYYINLSSPFFLLTVGSLLFIIGLGLFFILTYLLNICPIANKFSHTK